MKVTLYTTGCPQCKVLKQKLDSKKIAYEIVDDVKVMLSKGFATAPMLEVDGEVMNTQKAFEWIGSR